MVEALLSINTELLGDFPFVGDAEKAHAVALLLQPFVRELIAGPTPLYIIEKPTPGTGASLLVEVLTYPALGRSPGFLTEGRDEDEWRKRLTAKLIRGEPVIAIDNLRRRLDAAALSAAITANCWEDRRLGVSENVRIPIKCVWVATGNNPALSAEMSRRSVRIRLDAKEDRPWLRSNFRHPDLHQWVAEHRAKIVWAALVLAQRWISEGRPIDPAAPKLGMFESWSEVMGGILKTNDIKGFLGNLDEFYDVSDAEGAAWRAFIASWWQKYQGLEITVSELLPLAETLDLGERGERSQKTRLGRQLSTAKDRRFGEFTIRKLGLIGGLQRWKLEAK
jgi:putative DNA primase/helicase